MRGLLLIVCCCMVAAVPALAQPTVEVGNIYGNIYLGSADYFVPVPSTPPCTRIQVTNHEIPTLPVFTPVAILCYGPNTPVATGGGFAVVNPDETCHCVDTVPVEESSWGQIKSLYE